MLNPIILSLQNVTKVTRISKGLIFRRNVTKRKRSKKLGTFFFSGTTETNVTKGDPMLNPIILSLQNVTKVTRISKGLIFRRNVRNEKVKKIGDLFFNGTTETNVTKGDPMLNPIILSLQNVTKVTRISKGLIF